LWEFDAVVQKIEACRGAEIADRSLFAAWKGRFDWRVVLHARGPQRRLCRVGHWMVWRPGICGIRRAREGDTRRGEVDQNRARIFSHRDCRDLPGLHLANHLTAAWSLETNKAIMDLLRVWYRSDVIQPLLLALFTFQLLSGLRLVWAKIPRDADVYSSIQTATGSYLAFYITSHLIAVFILGRIFLGIDTTFAWASGAPTGLLSDPWNVRLIPHYSLAVLFVISHFAMGARAILLGHGALVTTANRLAWIICGIGVAVSLLVTIAQLSVR